MIAAACVTVSASARSCGVASRAMVKYCAKVPIGLPSRVSIGKDQQPRKSYSSARWTQGFQRLFENVTGQDRSAGSGRQAAGERILSDNEPLHPLRVGFGHVSRASDRVKEGDVRVGDIEGGPRLARRLLGDDASKNTE